MAPTLPMINRSATKPVWLDESSPGAAEAISEHRDNYIRHPLPKITPPFKHSLPNIHAANLPFDYSTEQRTEYLDFCQPKLRYRTRRGQIKIPTAPFDSLTDYKSEFVSRNGGEKTKSYKPDGLSFFIGRNPENAVEPVMESQSMYRSDYHRHSAAAPLSEEAGTLQGGMKAQPVGGATTNAPTAVALQMQTEMKEKFQYPPATREYYPLPKWKQPKEPFCKETSYSAEFLPIKVGPARMCKPLTSSLHTDGDFYQGASTYKSDFVPKVIPAPQRNVYVNKSSLMHDCGQPGNWWDAQPNADSQPYLEFTDQLFYHT